MSQLILHIPHSGTRITYRHAYLLSDRALDLEILKLTDWYVDELFDDGDDLRIVPHFSRLFCDVERFPYDDMEVMAQYGMGVLYDRTDAGLPMRVLTEAMRWRIMNNYYNVHQRKLAHAVKRQLICYGKAQILDCHSYPDTPLIRDLDQDYGRPDFNIGTDPFHTSQALVDLSVEYFRKRGYSVGVNKPHSGSMVPMDFYQEDDRVHSIMVGVNQKLYYNDDEYGKAPRYAEIKEVISGYIKLLRLKHRQNSKPAKP